MIYRLMESSGSDPSMMISIVWPCNLVCQLSCLRIAANADGALEHITFPMAMTFNTLSQVILVPSS